MNITSLPRELAQFMRLLHHSAVCLGVGADPITALKIGGCCAVNSGIEEAAIRIFKSTPNTNEIQGQVRVPFYQVISAISTAITYRQASLILGSSVQVANWIMVVKLISTGMFELGINWLIEGISSKDQQEYHKFLAKNLISCATLSVIARIAGCSNKIAVLATAIFSIPGVITWIAIPSKIFLEPSKRESFLEVFSQAVMTSCFSVVMGLAQGRALRPLLSQ